MTNTIYRYRLNIIDEQTISMPTGAEILTVARREGAHRALLGVGSHEPVEMWALVDPDAPMQERRIRIAGTGHPLADVDNLAFLGSVQIAQGQLVFHVFEILDDDTQLVDEGE